MNQPSLISAVNSHSDTGVNIDHADFWYTFLYYSQNSHCLEYLPLHWRYVRHRVGFSKESIVLQVYEVHNNGAVPVCYEVDSAVLSQLQVDNFNHPVLRCLNPKGEVLPGQTAMLEWIFSPLEVKMYHVRIETNSAYLLLPSYHWPLWPFIQLVLGNFNCSVSLHCIFFY